MPNSSPVASEMALLGLLSGLFSGISFVLPGGFLWMPGAIFGMAIMIPLILTARTTHRPARIACGIIASIVSYVISVLIVMEFRRSGPAAIVLGMGVSGLVGSSVLGICVLTLLGRWYRIRTLVLTVFTGATAGAVFGLLMIALSSSGGFELIKVTLGFMLWQCSTAVALSRD